MVVAGQLDRFGAGVRRSTPEYARVRLLRFLRAALDCAEADGGLVS